MSEKKIKMMFGLQEHHINRINEERARWNQPDNYIPGTVPDAILIEEFWGQLGRELGWAPFTLALHYFKAECRIIDNTQLDFPRWVKASDRLPGLNTPVKWRFDGVEREGKCSLSKKITLLIDLYGWEWFDESSSL